jgi:2-polyprenyl-6-methoxyphenol hydroxylase-like FAD-dependent oxidoreductase
VCSSDLPALALLRSVLDRPGLFADRPRVSRRVVAWGKDDPVALPHGALVVSEADLDAAFACGPSPAAGPAAFHVHTAAPFPEGALQRFGDRRTEAAEVRFCDPADSDACWIEAVGDGWLFLTPAGGDRAILLSVGAPADTLLPESRLIAGRVAAGGEPFAGFDTTPRLHAPLQGPDWFACGTAAMAFDPICGDGTAQAAREAILVSAVISAIVDGGDREALREHYESMMLASMRRHLRLCAGFYASGGDGSWWRRQLAGLAEGFERCTERLARAPEPRYALHGFRLVAREAVT